jgi:hypothetical protein
MPPAEMLKTTVVDTAEKLIKVMAEATEPEHALVVLIDALSAMYVKGLKDAKTLANTFTTPKTFNEQLDLKIEFMEKPVAPDLPRPKAHEVVRFEECSLMNSDHAHSHNYSRAICKCRWKSAPSPDHRALVALFAIHAATEKL